VVRRRARPGPHGRLARDPARRAPERVRPTDDVGPGAVRAAGRRWGAHAGGEWHHRRGPLGTPGRDPGALASGSSTPPSTWSGDHPRRGPSARSRTPTCCDPNSAFWRSQQLTVTRSDQRRASGARLWSNRHDFLRWKPVDRSIWRPVRPAHALPMSCRSVPPQQGHVATGASGTWSPAADVRPFGRAPWRSNGHRRADWRGAARWSGPSKDRGDVSRPVGRWGARRWCRPVRRAPPAVPGRRRRPPGRRCPGSSAAARR
jgi:hypothetical protein